MTWVDSNMIRGNGVKSEKERFRLDVRGEFFTESDEVLEQASRRGCGCSVSGNVQGQGGWSPGQSDLVT